MDSSGASKIKESVLDVLANLKHEISSGRDALDKANARELTNKVNQLEESYNKLLTIAKSNNTLVEFLDIQTELERLKNNLLDQINSTNDNIWSVDRNLHIKTVNQEFANNYKTAFGVELKEGVSVIVSLPEFLKSVWKERYARALEGEQFSIVDHFDIEGVPQYTETSFNPIKIEDGIVGVACFSRDISKQKENEEQFILLAKISPNPISIISVDGYLYVNDAWQEVFGYSKEEAYSSGIGLILPKENIEDNIKQIKKFILFGKKNLRNTYPVIPKSGKKIWLDVASTPIKFNNKKAILSVSTDVSELLELQQELKNNKANLLSQLNNTDARIWSIDSELKIVNINENFRNDFKTAFNVDLSEGVSSLKGLPVEFSNVWKQRYKRALGGEKYTIIEEFNIENIPQFVEVSFNPIEIDNEIVGVSCFSRDITDRKNAEIALKESEQRFKTLVDNIPSTTYRCSFDEHRTIEFVSDEIEPLSGYPASDFIDNNVRSFASIVRKEDVDYINKTIDDSIKKKESYRLEYRIEHKNGTLKWVHERGRAIFSKNGDLLWLDGVISDITIRRQSEKALRESEEQYRAIFNSISDVFIRTELNGNILIVSPSIIDLFGFTPDEVVGKSIVALYKNPESRKELVHELTDKGFVREFETTFISKNGEEKIASINAKLLLNDHSEPYGIEAIIRDITKRKMAQLALEERTRELDSIFENTPIILLLIDSAGRVLNINQQAGHNYHGGKKHLINLLAGEAIKCVNSFNSDYPCGKGKNCGNCIIRKTIRQTFLTKQNQDQIEGSITFFIEEQEIERRFLISTTYIKFDKNERVLISLDDITETREAEEEIRRLSAAVEQSTATVVITDYDGNIEYVNPQFEKTTGYASNEVLGKNPRILRSGDTPPEIYADLWNTIKNGDTWQGEFLNVKKDSTKYWESAIISPIANRNGKITHFIAIKDDITERKQIHEELIRSEKELREMNDEKTRYFSILAHDLRGLVGSFHAYTDLIKTHFDDYTLDEVREQISNLTNVSGDSLNLLDNLLTWGKATQGGLSLKLNPIDISDEVNSVIGVTNEIASNKNIQLLNTIPKNTIIETDSNAFQTIIRNLISNAIKFTPPEGLITVASESIENNLIEISVIDTGIGMNNKILNNLFKLDEKVKREGTNSEYGSGLGLIICKELVKKLCGTIDVVSEVGTGTRFFIRLPRN